MDLRQRLARLDRTQAGPPPSTRVEDPAVVAAELGLEAVAVAGTIVWRRRLHRHLPPPAEPPALRGFFARDPGDIADASDLLLLDTETTGLVGGTGTLPFLVGLAWWEKDQFVVEQIMLPGPGHEPALLASVEAAAAGRRAVVTYNGASFDLPLLRTRALLNRRGDPVGDLAVWDLVVAARRLWGRSLENCRQQTVEALLHGQRPDDGEVPGAQIPAVWFDFLAGQGHGRLAGVLRHNRRDMEGMARVLLSLWSAAADLDADRRSTPADWRGAWSRGRICEYRGETGRAAGWMRRALAHAEASGEERLAADALRLLKRDRDWGGAAAAAQAALFAGVDEPWLHREIAMLHEHRLGDLDKALAHALRAGDDYRVQRLRRRGAGEPLIGEDAPCPT